MALVDLREIGLRICERRRQKGLTQEQLAAMMDVSVQMISNLERGNKAVKIENLVNLSRILEVSTDYILTGMQTVQDSNLLSQQIAKLSSQQQDLLKVMIEHCLAINA